MSNLLEHLKEMKSQAELVDAWQKAFDVAIRLCTKKDTVIADLQKENERLHEQIRIMRLGYTKSIEYDLSPAMVESKLRTHLIEQMGWMPPEDIATLQEKYDKLKERVEGAHNMVLYKDLDDGELYLMPIHAGDNSRDVVVALVELPEEMDGK